MVVFHLLSISQYSRHSNHSGHVYCYTIMNHLQHHLLCASDLSAAEIRGICIEVPFS